MTSINKLIKKWNRLIKTIFQYRDICIKESNFEPNADVKVHHVLLGIILVLSKDENLLNEVRIMEETPFLSFGNFEYISQSPYATLFVSLPVWI